MEGIGIYHISEFQKIIGIAVIFAIFLISWVLVWQEPGPWYKKMKISCTYFIVMYVILASMVGIFWVFLWFSISFREIIQWIIETL